MIKLFVTGTDTHVGKTYTSVGLLKAFQRLNYTAMGLKPVATGAQFINGQLINEDGLALQQASSIKLPYGNINPYVFEPAIAPHIAAHKIGKTLTLAAIEACLKNAFSVNADVYVIEGAGGWSVPLNDDELLSDLAFRLNCGVILVVAMKLGALNHALLTAAAIKNKGLALVGWVANCLEPNLPVLKENIETLHSRLNSPCLGVLPLAAQPETNLTIKALL